MMERERAEAALAQRELDNASISSVPTSEYAPASEYKPFVFSEKKDDKGVRLQDPAYVKRGCTKCNGRGFNNYLVVTEPGRGVVAEKKRFACRCVRKGYVKARAALAAREKAEAALGV